MFDECELAEADQEALLGVLKRDAWSKYVSVHTRFESWQGMLTVANAENLRKRLDTFDHYSKVSSSVLTSQDHLIKAELEVSPIIDYQRQRVGYGRAQQHVFSRR